MSLNQIQDNISETEQELDYDLKQLGDAIEPLLIIVIAGMVLVLALGVFLPMWDISSVALGSV